MKKENIEENKDLENIKQEIKKENMTENKEFKKKDLDSKRNQEKKQEENLKENKEEMQNKEEKQNQKEKKGFFSNNKVKKLEKEIEELKEKLEEEKLDKLRVLAEFENYRNRMQKTLEESRERAIINFIEDILPVIDNFELSLKMTDNKDMFIKGVEMIHKNLVETLKNYHIESFEPGEMEEFDPYLHDPVPIENKEAPEGKVIGVLKKGYKHKDKIIRPARVNVKKVETKVEEKEENNSKQEETSNS